ncbi:hypothetical protein P9112_010969 [Eukaryota sp. TZLM1-RC]
MKQAKREEDIPLGLSTMRNYFTGAIPFGPGAKRRSGSGSKGTPQNKYVPERHEREGSKFCTFCNVTEKNNPIGHTVFECKDPHCARSKVTKELRFKIGEADQPARSGSVIRGRGGRARRVSRCRGIFSEVFSETPNRTGIDCNPLTIPFRNENAIVHKPARRLNSSKMEIATKKFDELIEMGYAVESNCKFSSPIVLVIYPDGKKPRLTGDFSGKNGVNAHTISVEPDLPD